MQCWLTKRKPDLRAWDHLPLLYVIVETVSPAQVVRFLANGLRRREIPALPKTAVSPYARNGRSIQKLSC